MHFIPRFNEYPIKYKLLIGYSILFFVVITLVGFIVNSFIKQIIENNIESELKSATFAISELVNTSASVSIKSYLRALAEKNRDMITHFNQQYKTGKIRLEEAQRQATALLLSQKIGPSGYLYSILSDSRAVAHPNQNVTGVDYSDKEFVKKMIRLKEGYIEYDWTDPGSIVAKQKVLYMAYFEPWDWIICASAYRAELAGLVNVGDFEESILSLGFGKSGYSFVFDTKGKIIIHPKIEYGSNFINHQDSQGRQFVRDMVTRKNGKMIYSWKNPDEKVAREKLVMFRTIKDFNWIVASSSYLDEIYEPLRTVRNIILMTVLVAFILVTLLSIWYSSLITNPLCELMRQFTLGAQQDFTIRMEKKSKDEFGTLALYFNNFMEKLEEYSVNIQKEVTERKHKEKDLRVSEEMFSKAFRTSPNGIFIATLKDYSLVNVNDSFIRQIGFRRDEIIDRPILSSNFMRLSDADKNLMKNLGEHDILHDHQLFYRTKAGEERIGSLSLEIIKLWDEPTVFGTIEDITERKHLEREVIKIGEIERQQIGQNLHDDLCPHLIGIDVLSKLLENKLAKHGYQEAEQAKKIRMLIGDAVTKSRNMARGLCPVHFTSDGLESSLQELTQHIQAIYSVSCELNCQHPVMIDDSHLATHLFYIAQEAVNNSVRHGKADKITITLALDENELQLSVMDNGSGIGDHKNSNGMGLKIMKYRANIIGATLDIQTKSDYGTCISVITEKSDLSPTTALNNII